MKSTLNYSDTNDEKVKRFEGLDILKYFVLMVLSILISFINIKFNNENIVIPVSVAFLVAMIVNDIPIGGIIISQFITLGIRLGTGGVGIYIIEILMFILSIFILKPVEIKIDSERYKLGRRVVIITIIASILMYMNRYPFYTVCEFTIFSLCLEYIFYKIFSNGINVVKNLWKNKAFAEIELISFGILFAVAMIPLLGISNKAISLIAGILIMADLWIVSARIKLQYGVIAATVLCILFFVMVDEPINYFPYFAIIGLVSNLFNKINKKIFLVITILTAGLAIYFNIKYRFDLILIELLVSMIVLCFIKPINKFDYDSDVKMLPEAIMEIEEKQTAEGEQKKEKFSNFRIKLKNAMSYNKTNILYDELYKDRNSILKEIFDILNENKSISEEEIIKILNEKKIYFAEENNKIDEEIQMMQVKGVTRLINNIFMNIK